MRIHGPLIVTRCALPAMAERLVPRTSAALPQDRLTIWPCVWNLSKCFFKCRCCIVAVPAGALSLQATQQATAICCNFIEFKLWSMSRCRHETCCTKASTAAIRRWAYPYLVPPPEGDNEITLSSDCRNKALSIACSACDPRIGTGAFAGVCEVGGVLTYPCHGQELSYAMHCADISVTCLVSCWC